MSSATFKAVEEQLAYLKKGVAEIIPEDQLKADLEKSRKTGRPLRVYLGVDPTAPDLHLGHTVVLRKLKHFQDLGHTAVFLIGDFSAMIGDPTGVSANAKTYLDQVFKILDREKTEVRYNSEWLGKMSATDVVRLCSHYRLARMLEREDFSSRLEKGQPISVHELLYPLLTAYDAVSLKSDVELGATEQKFNLLVHREIQREYGLPGQSIVTMPILVGLDGSRKMSKSLGNYVGITEPPQEMFGKLMSIADVLMWNYYELATDRSATEIATLKSEVASGKLHPMDAKMKLGEEVVSTFHGVEAGRMAAENFQRVFRDRQAPAEMKVIRLKPMGSFIAVERPVGVSVQKETIKGLSSVSEKWSRILQSLGLASSVGEAERLIKQGGFEIDDQPIKDPATKLNLTSPGSYKVRVGKKEFRRIVVE
jgi:tyrosyl-tRNA synthetase